MDVIIDKSIMYSVGCATSVHKPYNIYNSAKRAAQFLYIAYPKNFNSTEVYMYATKQNTLQMLTMCKK